MDTRIEAQTDIARDRRWFLEDGEVFVNVTGPLGAAGPVQVHLMAALCYGPGRVRPFSPTSADYINPTLWARHLADLLGNQVSVVLSVPLPSTDRTVTPFIDIDGARICVSLGATTKRSRAALRSLIIQALDALVTPKDETSQWFSAGDL